MDYRVNECTRKVPHAHTRIVQLFLMLHRAYCCSPEGLQGANTRKVLHAHGLQKSFMKHQKHTSSAIEGLQGENTRKVPHALRLRKIGGHLPCQLPRLVWSLRTTDRRQCPGPQYPSNMPHVKQWLERDSEPRVPGKGVRLEESHGAFRERKERCLPQGHRIQT